MFVKAVFKSSFCFTYVLFVAAVAVYHVNNVFRVTVYMMSNMSSFAGRMKCVAGTLAPNQLIRFGSCKVRRMNRALGSMQRSKRAEDSNHYNVT